MGETKCTRRKEQVYYKNRFGIEIAGDLYMAKDADLTQQYPALVIGPPFGGVKEQGPGVYANELAQRGFVVLAFDPSYHGYSGGEPRMTGEARQEMLTMASEQRWEDFGKDEAAWRVSYPEEPTEEIPDGRCFCGRRKCSFPCLQRGCLRSCCGTERTLYCTRCQSCGFV